MLKDTLRLRADSRGRFSIHVWITLALFATLCGCTGVRTPSISEPTLPTELLREPAAEAEPAPATAARKPDAHPATTTKQDELPAQIAALEKLLIVYENPAVKDPADLKITDAWYQKLTGSTQPFSSDRTPRWMHPGLKRWSDLKQPPPLEPALLSKKKYVATTAAIQLARNPAVRSGGLAGPYQQQMHDIINGDSATMPQRRAAIEALGFLKDNEFLQATVDAKRDILSQREASIDGLSKEETARQRQQREDAALLLEEAMFALAANQQIQPGDLVFALKLPLPALQIAALQIITHQQDAAFPHEAVPLIVSGRTGRVRIAALQAAARRQHAPALGAIEKAASGGDQTIKLEAVATLGALGTDEAIEALRKIYAGSLESISCGAVEALGNAGDWVTVQTAATHEARRIRAQAARSLGQAEPQMAVPLLKRLLDDKSIEVRTAAISGVEKLPVAHAGPLLLGALESSAPRTRVEAFQALAKIWPTAADTGVDQFAGEHEVVAPRLRQQWNKQHPANPADAAANQLATAETGTTVHQPPSEQLLRDIRLWMKWSTMSDQKLRDTGVQRLQQLGDKLPSHLHTLVTLEQRPADEVVPANIFARILPAVDEDFATIEQLGSDLPSIRRIAARKLAVRAAVRPLPAIAVTRILHYMRPTDPVETQIDLVRATHGQPTAAPLLESALLSEFNAVQKVVCEEIASSGSPRFVPHLLPLLQSNEPTVLAAAITALGQCGPLEDTSPLRQLLRHRNPQTGVAAAAALLQMQDDEGAAALERFALHDEKNVRRQAIIAMGDSRDPQFQAALLQSLNDETSVRESALDALPKVTGTDPSTGAVNTTGRIAAWKAWAARQ